MATPREEIPNFLNNLISKGIQKQKIALITGLSPALITLITTNTTYKITGYTAAVINDAFNTDFDTKIFCEMCGKQLYNVSKKSICTECYRKRKKEKLKKKEREKEKKKKSILTLDDIAYLQRQGISYTEITKNSKKYKKMILERKE